jgi:hypothetical protein
MAMPPDKFRRPIDALGHPLPGTWWKSRDHRLYRVVFMANIAPHSMPRHPPTVVCYAQLGAVITAPLSDWLVEMQPADFPPP